MTSHEYESTAVMIVVVALILALVWFGYLVARSS